MTGEIHEFDARVGGGYRMSLFYPPDGRAFRGKTSDREDMVDVRIVELAPPRRIVETVSFVTTDPGFFGEMTLIATFEEVSGGTEVTLMFNAGRSTRGEINQREAFLPRRIGKALIERDDLERRGTVFRGYEGRCQLQCVRPTQRVHTKKSYRTLADDVAGFNLMPAVGELRQSVERERDPFDVERSGALEAGQGRGAFHFRPPPHQHVGIPRCEHLQASRRRFGDQQRHDRRGIPKFHRPSRRSSTSASTADAGTGARRLAAEELPGWLRAPGPHNAVTEEPRQPSVLLTLVAGGDRL
jgi:Activator of Hsp90 ATPase homolog 1-like protein